MIELSDKYWLTQNDDKQKENINQLIKIITKAILNGDTLIYYPARQQLFVNHHWIWCFNPPKIPITFEEFLDNRSLSKYIQKASKEINYGNSNKNNNNN